MFVELSYQFQRLLIEILGHVLLCRWRRVNAELGTRLGERTNHVLCPFQDIGNRVQPLNLSLGFSQTPSEPPRVLPCRGRIRPSPRYRR